ncbi:MAG TPA: hypothetical protein DIW46_08380 [Microbacterium sp.]|nr:hypothetical protein [Microbacterium sp.]
MTADAVQVVEGWRAEDLAGPLGVRVEDVVRVLSEAVTGGTVVRLECGSETLYAVASIKVAGQ